MQKRTVTLIKKVTTEYKVKVTIECSDERLKELFNNGQLDLGSHWKEIDGTTDSEIVSIEEDK